MGYDTACGVRAAVLVGGSKVTSEPAVRLLGVTLDENLNFSAHVNEMCRRAGVQLNVLQRLGKFLDLPSRMAIFRCFIPSLLISALWCGTSVGKCILRDLKESSIGHCALCFKILIVITMLC